MPIDNLGEHLIACGVVTKKLWAEVASRAGSNDPGAALNILSRTRAPWAPEDDGTARALTPYQIEQIGAWLGAPNGAFPADRLVWNNYLLLDKLAAGGMGVVFKGWCLVRRRYVAIKRTLSDSGELRRRLRREAELLQQLHHTGVAEFYAREPLGQDDLLVMEFVPGKTLFAVTQERIAKGSPVPWRTVAEWAVELLGALDHLNGNNATGVVMVHRDVKPSNVMLRLEGKRYRPLLVDFGLARAAEGGTLPAGTGEPALGELTKNFQFLGTPEYAAPEQWNGGRFALPASDVYSLGGALYYALTGRPPFGPMPAEAATTLAAMMQMMTRHRTASRPRVRAERPDVPPEMDALLGRMMAVDPLDRGDPAQLRARFEALLGGAAPSAVSAPLRQPEVPAAPAPAPPQKPVGPSGTVKAPSPRTEKPAPPPPVPPSATKAPATPQPPVLPQPSAVPPPVLTPDTATYQLETSAPAPGTGTTATRRKKPPTAESPPRPSEPVVAVEAAEPPSPATGEVFGAFFEWFGARLGGPRREFAPRLWREFLRRGGAWLRAYSRPLAHPGRWAFLLAVVALVGLTAGWDWAFIPLAVVSLLVVFAFLGEE